jgi:hypothetical protein
VCRIHYLVLSSHRRLNKHSNVQLKFLSLCAIYSNLYYPPTVFITDTLTFICSSSVCAKYSNFYNPPTMLIANTVTFICSFSVCAHYSTLYYPPTAIITNTVTFSCSSSLCADYSTLYSPTTVLVTNTVIFSAFPLCVQVTAARFAMWTDCDVGVAAASIICSDILLVVGGPARKIDNTVS